MRAVSSAARMETMSPIVNEVLKPSKENVFILLRTTQGTHQSHRKIKTSLLSELSYRQLHIVCERIAEVITGRQL